MIKDIVTVPFKFAGCLLCPMGARDNNPLVDVTSLDFNQIMLSPYES